MKILTSIAGLSLLMLACGSASSDVHFPFETWGWEDSSDRVISDDFLSLSSIEIGSSTLEDVTTKFGAAAAYRPGTENYLPDLICYLSDSDDTAVVFQSGPLGGWSIVTAIWVGNSQHIDVAKCATSSEVDHQSATVHGISLGSSFSTIADDLGEPTFNEPPFVAYRFQREETSGDENYVDITSGLEMELKMDRVVWFRVYRQVSN